MTFLLLNTTFTAIHWVYLENTNRPSSDEVLRGIQMANIDDIVKGNTERVKKKSKDKHHTEIKIA